MRISDWSSDVCSSDLLAPTNPFAVVILAQLDANATRDGPARMARKTELVLGLYLWGFSRDNVIKLFRIIEDRKSVVKGKSVSVRVDLGGRRILKKKKHQ